MTRLRGLVSLNNTHGMRTGMWMNLGRRRALYSTDMPQVWLHDASSGKVNTASPFHRNGLSCHLLTGVEEPTVGAFTLVFSVCVSRSHEASHDKHRTINRTLDAAQQRWRSLACDHNIHIRMAQSQMAVASTGTEISRKTGYHQGFSGFGTLRNHRFNEAGISRPHANAFTLDCVSVDHSKLLL